MYRHPFSRTDLLSGRVTFAAMISAALCLQGHADTGAPDALPAGATFYASFDAGSTDATYAAGDPGERLDPGLAPHGRWGKAVGLTRGAQLKYAGTDNIPGTTGTLEAWIKPQWKANEQVTLFNYDSSSSDSQLLINKSGSTDRLIVKRTSNRGSSSQASVDKASLNEATGDWMHLAVTWNGGRPSASPHGDHRTRVYLNGTLVAQSNDIQLGADFADTDVADFGGTGDTGLIDEIVFYSRVLTDEEVETAAARSGAYVARSGAAARQ